MSRRPAILILESIGVRCANVSEDGRWHNGLLCPMCQKNKLSVMLNPNGTGGWLCHNCEFRHNERQICASQSQPNMHDVLGSAITDYYPKLGVLVGSVSTAVILSRLLYMASKKEWDSVSVTDRHLMVELRVPYSQVKRLKDYLKQQPWARVWHGAGNWTHYRFDPVQLGQTLDRIQLEEDDDNQL